MKTGSFLFICMFVLLLCPSYTKSAWHTVVLSVFWMNGWITYQNYCAHFEALLQLSFCVMRYFRTSWLKTNTVLLYLVTLWVGNLNKSPLSNLSVQCGMDWVPWWYSAEGCSGGPRTTSLTWGIECEWCLLPLWGLLDDVACVVSGPHLRAVRLLSWRLRISRSPGGSCKTYYPAS